MSETTTRIKKITPFLISDLLMLLVAGVVVYYSDWPLHPWQVAVCAGCVFAGSLILILPYLLEYRIESKLAELEKLNSLVSQIQKMEEVSKQIASATNLWQVVQGEAGRTAELAKEIQETMSREAQAFMEFMKKANDIEKATLRLEVDKLRRAQDEWVMILTRILDQVNALYMAGVQSGQQNLIQQFSLFQNNCRQIAQRVGLNAFDGVRGEKFNPEKHALPENNKTAPENAVVSAALAPGYSFRGKIIRPALVAVQSEKQSEVAGS